MVKSTFQFPFFNSFPPEIHSLILELCSSIDRVCLSLTCKYLYSLAAPFQIPTGLNSVPIPAVLCTGATLPENFCTARRSPEFHWFRYCPHRRTCHALCHINLASRLEQQGLPVPESDKCKTRSQMAHCQCFVDSKALYERLRTWVPKELKYCYRCERFTFRKKSQNWRCFHGRPKPRQQSRKFWTHRSRKGGFGWRMWRKWFTNAAMNSMERRLRLGDTRHENKRYALRRIEPRAVDSKEVRNNHARW